jgi:hypothetical protein
MGLSSLPPQIRLYENCKDSSDDEGAAHEEVTRQIAVWCENPTVGKSVNDTENLAPKCHDTCRAGLRLWVCQLGCEFECCWQISNDEEAANIYMTPIDGFFYYFL